MSTTKIVGQDSIEKTATQYEAGADKFGRLRTFATTQAQESHASSQKQSFHASTNTVNKVLTIPDTFTGYVLLIKNNNDDQNAAIQEIDVQCEGALVTTVVKEPVFSVVTGDDDGTYVNNNYDTQSVANATSNIWDNSTANGIQGVTGGLNHITWIGETRAFINGAIKASSGDTIGIFVDNTTGGSIDLVVNIRFFFEF